ncbi:cell division protein FtsL [Bacillus pakistanensis]|uniref:Cell division protein FtsL n=1 Tax=Rossellomorea pakistanensis TaxID=992288 RepID=A0ABS2NKG4_9BACI|nr:YtzI protein [Bacillus pakistanensis]MBM7588361.1 cell division protein FtsL [Bacillus pakistanensis]
MAFTISLIVSIVIVFIVLILAVVTTSKAYTVKHKVDPIENNPHLKRDENSTGNPLVKEDESPEDDK